MEQRQSRWPSDEKIIFCAIDIPTGPGPHKVAQQAAMFYSLLGR